MKKDSKRDSFTAADNMPVKVVKDETLVGLINKGVIPPIHVQYIPTNNCNMSCDFCSCDDEDRSLEMPIEKVKPMIEKFKDHGTKAVTITGGGEPLMHPQIDTILGHFYTRDIKMGLVSNGLKLKDIHPDFLNLLTWCRISNGDFRRFTDKYSSNLENVVKNTPDVDWAFSHVVSSNPNYGEIEKVVRFANDHDFTHVRLVSDLFNTENVPMSAIKTYLYNKGVKDDKVIYQGRKNPEKGMDCYIAYLKPLIAADGSIYRCCGVQYAINGTGKKLPEQLKMGHIDNFGEAIYDLTTARQGKQCDKCYYGSYNRTLESMLGDIEHEEFV